MLNLQWLSENAPLINSFGVSFNVIGAGLVAWKAVGQRKGKRHRVSIGVAISELVASEEAADTKKIQDRKPTKNKKMKIGLVFLTFGFALQLISGWVK